MNPNSDTPRGREQQWRLFERTFGNVVSKLPADALIVDVGCGTGILLGWLAARRAGRLVGVEKSYLQARAARLYVPDATVICIDGLSFLSSYSRYFDCVFCTDVLEHIESVPETVALVQSARMALKSGGYFVCRVPNAASLLSTYCRYVDLTHHRLYTATSLVQLLEAGGFSTWRIYGAPAGSRIGAARQWCQELLTKTVFWFCGNRSEKVFTVNLCAVARA